MSYWQPGTQIMWRYGDDARLDFACPMTVVQDDERALVAWLAAGTPVLKVVRADGQDLRAVPEDAFTVERKQVESVWVDYSVLRVYQPGRRWSVWHFFHGETGAFEGWYVNIEEPHARSGTATRSRDQVLDVWVEPDRSVERKDDEELTEAVAQGRFTPQEAVEIRAVADEVEAVIERWDSPFCDGWDRFLPDPSWRIPGLPPPTA